MSILHRSAPAVALIAASVALAACGSSGSKGATAHSAPPSAGVTAVNATSASAPAPSASAATVTAASATALASADGKKIGGSIDLLGVLSGSNLTAYLATLKPFEDATGIKINYEGTQDISAVLQTRIAGGNPPDVVSDPSAGEIHTLAEQGKLISLDDIVNVATVKAQFPAGLVSLGSANGHLYGIPGTTAVAGLVWYDPKNYKGPTTGTLAQLDTWIQQTAASGKTPLCIGLESGPASGWPGAVWIEQFMLQQSGAAAYNQWWQGQLPWTSPAVRAAFASFGAYATNSKIVSGGATAALTSNFAKSPLGLFNQPPSCFLHVQADWLGNSMAQTVPNVKPVTDIDFFPFPAVTSGEAPGVVTSGEMFGALKDTPQDRALMQYVTTPQFSSLIAASGLWIGPNQQTTTAAYTTALERQAAQLYASSKTVVYGAQDGMPAAMSTAFHAAIMSYVKNPSSLDQILTQLDQVEKTAYTN